MQERITNNYSAFIKEVKYLLTSPVNNAEFSFLEFPQLVSDAFAIHYAAGKLVLKYWPGEKYPLGVYNLDRIIIKEASAYPDSTQIHMLDQAKIKQPFITPLKGIILDGYIYQLTYYVSSSIFEWNDHSQLDSGSLQLVQFLQASAQKMIHEV